MEQKKKYWHALKTLHMVPLTKFRPRLDLQNSQGCQCPVVSMSMIVEHTVTLSRFAKIQDMLQVASSIEGQNKPCT